MFRFVFGSLVAVKNWVDTVDDRVSRTSGTSRRQRRALKSRKLAVEKLEDRCVPATVFTASFFDGAVYQFDSKTGALENTLVAPYAPGLLSGPAGLTLGPDNNLYISSQLNNSILEYNLTSKTLTTFIPSTVLQPIAQTVLGSATANFAPAGLTFGPDGALYVALNGGQTSTGGGVERFGITSGSGSINYNGTATSIDSIGLVQPSGLTFGTAAGDTTNLYVANSGLGSVLKINGATTGTPSPTTFIPAGSDSLNFPSAITFGPDGKLYVVGLGATSNLGQILRFNADGTFDTVFNQLNSSSQGSLDFQFPSSAAFDTQGDLFTANLGPAYPPTLQGSIYEYGSNGVFDQTLVSSSAFPNTGTGTSGIAPSQILVVEPPTITSAAFASFPAGTAESFTVTTAGTPTIGLSISGSLPTGVTFNTATGVLSGSSTVAGTYNDTITATNAFGSASQTFSFTIESPQQHFVESLYQADLGRSGDLNNPQDAGYWVTGLMNGTMTNSSVATGISTSFAAQDLVVKGWYQSYLGRPALNGEENYWVGLLQQGQTQEQVLSQIFATTEFFNHAQTLISTGTTDERYVQALYQLLLSRTGSTGDVAYWVNTIPQGGTASVALGFLTTQEYRTDLFTSYYTTLLHRTPATGEVDYWVFSKLDAASVRIGFEESPEFFTNG